MATAGWAQDRSDIGPRGGYQTIRHDQRPQPQVFAAALWDVNTKSKRGATVVLSCGPFQSAVDPGSYVDGQLGLRVRASHPHANWTVQVAADRTNIAGRNRTATVVATSEDKGAGTLELTVTFLGADVLDLVEGDYDTVVTGTITAH